MCGEIKRLSEVCLNSIVITLYSQIAEVWHNLWPDHHLHDKTYSVDFLSVDAVRAVRKGETLTMDYGPIK